jgi:hypothetical protein
MRKFQSLRSAVKQVIGSTGYKPVHVLGDGVPKADIPGMVSSDEMAFFTESAARYFGKEGAIVDLGCWLGSTSIALAQGILSHGAKADHSNEKVLGFDRFQWESWMPAHIPSCRYEPGDIFLPEAQRVVSEHGGGKIELIPADLGQHEWSGGPIKILLVDAMKNEELAIRIPRNFFPSLVPGSLLIHQDFKHYYTSWIHVLQYQLRQYFRFYRSVRWGTVAFEVLASIPREAVDRATEFAKIPEDETDASFGHSLGLVGPDERANIAAAHVMHYVHLKRKEKALQTVEFYRPLGLLDQGEFPQTLHLLNQAG